MYGYSSPAKSEIKQRVDAIAVLKFGKPLIYKLKIDNTEYKIQKTGLHFVYKKGTILYHVFGVVSGNTYFKVELNTKSLNFYLLEQKVFD